MRGNSTQATPLQSFRFPGKVCTNGMKYQYQPNMDMSVTSNATARNDIRTGIKRRLPSLSKVSKETMQKIKSEILLDSAEIFRKQSLTNARDPYAHKLSFPHQNISVSQAPFAQNVNIDKNNCNENFHLQSGHTTHNNQMTQSGHTPHNNQITHSGHTPHNNQMTQSGHTPHNNQMTHSGHTPHNTQMTQSGHTPHNNQMTQSGHTPHNNQMTQSMIAGKMVPINSHGAQYPRYTNNPHFNNTCTKPFTVQSQKNNECFRPIVPISECHPLPSNPNVRIDQSNYTPLNSLMSNTDNYYLCPNTNIIPRNYFPSKNATISNPQNIYSTTNNVMADAYNNYLHPNPIPLSTQVKNISVKPNLPLYQNSSSKYNHLLSVAHNRYSPYHNSHKCTSWSNVVSNSFSNPKLGNKFDLSRHEDLQQKNCCLDPRCRGGSHKLMLQERSIHKEASTFNPCPPLQDQGWAGTDPNVHNFQHNRNRYFPSHQTLDNDLHRTEKHKLQPNLRIESQMKATSNNQVSGKFPTYDFTPDSAFFYPGKVNNIFSQSQNINELHNMHSKINLSADKCNSDLLKEPANKKNRKADMKTVPKKQYKEKQLAKKKEKHSNNKTTAAIPNIVQTSNEPNVNLSVKNLTCSSPVLSMDLRLSSGNGNSSADGNISDLCQKEFLDKEQNIVCSSPVSSMDITLSSETVNRYKSGKISDLSPSVASAKQQNLTRFSPLSSKDLSLASANNNLCQKVSSNKQNSSLTDQLIRETTSVNNIKEASSATAFKCFTENETCISELFDGNQIYARKSNRKIEEDVLLINDYNAVIDILRTVISDETIDNNFIINGTRKY